MAVRKIERKSSRGANATVVESSKLWWNGPMSLNQNQDLWPNVKPTLSSTNIDSIMKECKESINDTEFVMITLPNHNLPPGNPGMDELSVRNQNLHFESLLKRLSTLAGVLRVTSYVIRFTNNIRKRIRERLTRSSNQSKKKKKANLQRLIQHHQ